MLRVLGLLWKSLGEYYYDIVSLTWVNLLWLLTSVGPFVLFLYLAQVTGFPQLAIISLISLVFVPPSSGALMYTAQQFNQGESVNRHTVMTGFRRFFGLSWIVALTDAVLGGLLLVNCWFYLTRETTIFKLIGLIWVYGVLFWIFLQWYLWPLMVEQQRRRLLLLYRNSALLILDNFFFTLGLTAVLILFIALSLVLGLPALLFMGIVTCMVMHKSLILLLEKYPSTDGHASSPAGST